MREGETEREGAREENIQCSEIRTLKKAFLRVETLTPPHTVATCSSSSFLQVNSRKVLGSLIEKYGVTKEMFAPVCVIIDKLDKIGPDDVVSCVVQEEKREREK